MVRLGSHTVTVVRPAGKDRFSGDRLPGQTQTTVPGCFVQPRGSRGQIGASSEQTDMRDQVITDLVAYLPAGVDITATDRVSFAGKTYQVDGDPSRWADSHGVQHHLEVALREVEG
jgi:hypothetical protein